MEGGYHSGAPELIVEVAVSSYSRDFGVKKRLYESIGVREYVIALPGESRAVWFELTPGGFEALQPAPDGIVRSSHFPGLWLEPDALGDLDSARIGRLLQQGLATPEHAAFAAQFAARRVA